MPRDEHYFIEQTKDGRFAVRAKSLSVQAASSILSGRGTCPGQAIDPRRSSRRRDGSEGRIGRPVTNGGPTNSATGPILNGKTTTRNRRGDRDSDCRSHGEIGTLQVGFIASIVHLYGFTPGDS
jgi:hypothetical protein